MPDINELLNRIDAAFTANSQKVAAFQTQQVKQHQDRQQRLEKFDRLTSELAEVWRPRLEALAQRFGEKVKVVPRLTPGRREATLKFDSELAHINLSFSVFTDSDVRNLVFYYDLEILPILMKFESHAEIEFPLEAVDKQALSKWIDDRIVSFVTTYLSLHENTYYLKGHMVEDPIAKVQFPKYAAGAILEVDGRTYYFVSEETKDAYAEQRGLPLAAGKH